MEIENYSLVLSFCILLYRLWTCWFGPTLRSKPTLSQLPNDINRFHVLWPGASQNQSSGGFEARVRTCVCLCARKIKWQAECSASTNTGPQPG